MTCPEPFSIGGRFLAHWSQWSNARSVSSWDPHPAGRPNPSGAGCQDQHTDAAKIEHGRREDPFVQSAPQGGEQSSLHPDTSSPAAVEMQAKLDTVNNVGVGSSPPPAVALVLADPPHRCHPDTFAASGAPPSAPTSVLSPLPSRHHRLRHHAAVVVLTVAHLVAISHADGGRPVGSWWPLVGTAGRRRPHRCRCGRRLLPAEWCA